MAIKEKKDDKKSKLWEILSKDYKWENYVFFLIALVVLLLGVLILDGTISISSDAVLIGSYSTAFAWILVAFGSLAIIYALFPFFQTAFPELKRITWIKGRKYFGNILRVFIFLIVLCLLFILYDYFITEALGKILENV